ncbi:MAG: tryptophan synthase subunit alpha [Pontibacterium sp.]
MSALANFIHKQRESRQVLAMTHVIYGYPSVAESLEVMEGLLEAGAEILEVQFPFSDPVADGPAIVSACHHALTQSVSVSECLHSMKELSERYPNSRILLMSYLNPMYRYGLTTLVKDAAQSGVSGLIIPDLPYEQAKEYREACAEQGVEPIWLVTPATPPERLAFLASQSSGLLYCVSRSGVTGQTSQVKDESVAGYLEQIRAHTQTPLALGFGLREPEQVQALTNKAEIAIVGSALLEAFNQGGKSAVVDKYKSLFHPQA